MVGDAGGLGGYRPGRVSFAVRLYIETNVTGEKKIGVRSLVTLSGDDKVS